jgi:hypothetical protein
MQGSPRMQLGRSDVMSIVKGALLAAGGALVTYLSTNVVSNLDDSTMLGAAICGIASTALNALRKYLSDTQ